MNNHNNTTNTGAAAPRPKGATSGLPASRRAVLHEAVQLGGGDAAALGGAERVTEGDGVLRKKIHLNKSDTTAQSTGSS